jgi:predicted O-methyltransferase YrrM
MSEPSQQQYRFTASQDWFSHNIPSWTNLKVHVESPTPRILEIGSWEGRSGVWLLQNLCSEGGSLVCIDHFDLMNTPEGRDRYARMNHNLALAGGTFRILDSFSFPALMTLLGEEMQLENLAAGFDWIYVDGSHEADDTREYPESINKTDH